MQTNFSKVGFLAVLLVVSGCDSGMVTDAGNLMDAGGMMDAGRMDAGRRDSGSSDPCATAQADALDSVGCNGGLLGPDSPMNEFGGICMLDGTDPGTCTGTDAFCWGPETGLGICLQACTPSGEEYITTGDCPTGSRCFTFDFGSFCFADCESGDDCSSMNCDGEGSCIDPDQPEMDAGMPTDAGMMDAGMPTDAGMDTDAGTPTDAGSDAGTDAGADAGA